MEHWSRRFTCTICSVTLILLVGFSWLRPSQISCHDDLYATDTDTYLLDNISYHLPSSLKLKSPELHVRLRPSADIEDVHRAYYRYIITINIECRLRARVGRLTDGGWDMCLSGPYRPGSDCLVYSFGISQDWSFDDQISTEFGCRVRAFDPYIGLSEHQRSYLVKFYPVGLSSENSEKIYKGNIIKLRTLSRLIDELADRQRTIDFLKIDVEESEWEILPQILDDKSLRNVKQIALELHTNPDTSVRTYSAYLQTLYTLESQGFRKWLYHLNPRCTCLLEDINRYFSHCQEVYYINVNFLPSSRLA